MSEIHRGEDLVGITMIGVKGYGVSVEGGWMKIADSRAR